FGVRAVRVLRQEVVLDGPERVPAAAVAVDRLLQRVLICQMLTVGIPRLGDGNLVEQGELHDPPRVVIGGCGRSPSTTNSWTNTRTWSVSSRSMTTDGMVTNEAINRTIHSLTRR